MKRIKFVDSIVIDRPVNNKVLTDALGMVQKENTKLHIQADATHSGIITNIRVYPGRHVRDGHRTYFSKEKGGLAEFDKPILKHHNDEKDPIGRIVGAQFIQLKHGDDFDRDFLAPESGAGKGSGVARIDAEIVDQDSITKILDHRLLSVSSGHSSKSLLCSICGDELLSPMAKLFGMDSECDHFPGQFYELDDEQHLCYGITGPLTYHEVSFVNMPAQPSAKIVQSDWEELKYADVSESGIVIPTVSRGKKSIITQMTLTDADISLDLLSGREKSMRNKVQISVPSGTIDKLISSFDEESSDNSSPSDVVEQDETINSKGEDDHNSRQVVKPKVTPDSQDQEDHESLEDRGSDSSNAEGGNEDVGKLDKLESTRENDMVEKNDLSLDDLKATVKALTEQINTKNKELEAKDAEVTTAKTSIESKDSEIKRLTEDMSSLSADMTKELATCLANAKIILSKPGADSLDSREAFEEYVDTLSKRSIDSLHDSIADITLELNLRKQAEDNEEDVTTDSKEDETGTSVPDKEKLDSPALGSGAVATDSSNTEKTPEEALKCFLD